MRDDADYWDNLGANALAYGGLLLVGGFLAFVPGFVAVGAILGALDWLLFGGFAGAVLWAWFRFARWRWPPRSLRARSRIGRVKRA